MSEFNHGEAFCLMRYQCEKCRNVETLWNSRDGVTPFIIDCLHCPGAKAMHVDWRSDVRIFNYKPEVGTRIFVDCTPEVYKEKWRRNIDRNWDTGEYKMRDSFKSKDDALEKLSADFREGQPTIETVTCLK